MWNSHGDFSKITETAHQAVREPAQKAACKEHSITLFNFNGGLRNCHCFLSAAYTEPGRRAVSVIFKKCPLAMALHFSPFWHNQTFVFQMCLIMNRKNYSFLCPNMIYFDAVDFSECRSKEVISFFWRSVYSQRQCFSYVGCFNCVIKARQF